MAVYTAVSDSDLRAWLAGFPVGELRAFEGISSGIENTNYFVTTAAGEYVLTLFERLSTDELPFYLDLMHHLAEHGIPCPNPVAGHDGKHLGSLAGKPAALVTRLRGRANMQPSAAHCRAVGDMLARMHLAAAGFSGRQPNLRGIDWWRRTVPQVAVHLHAREREMLESELAVQSTFAASAAASRLPRAAVHADLFRDNVLFTDDVGGTAIGGVIDFYFAGVDTLLFDLAVTVNDWCVDDANGRFDPRRLGALLDAYRARRPVGRDEAQAWPYALRAAALRFWLSRLHDSLAPREAHTLQPKDPVEYERILAARRQDALAASRMLTD
ncbi:MAG: homoserine kinase [Burkholderiaceae bacterium]